MLWLGIGVLIVVLVGLLALLWAWGELAREAHLNSVRLRRGKL